MTRTTATPQTRDHAISFAAKPSMRLLCAILALSGRIAPRTTARFCLKLFLTPGRKQRPAWEQAHYSTAAIRREAFEDGNVAVYRWGRSDRKVLLCHAWGGRGTQLADFVPALLARGYEVLAFDAPGHGDSDGKQTDMVAYTRLIAWMAERFGPLHAIIGHSFGAGNTIYSRRVHGFPVARMALLGCFSDGEWIIDRFAELLHIPAAAARHMKSIHEARHHGKVRWSDFKLARMLGDESIPVLLVHDRKNMEIPYFHAEAFQRESAGRIPLLTTEGLGHRKIVRNPDVIAQVCDFLGA
ncbi:alpha/beta hydrolase (plasmid) [Ralstonia syzygii subsp. celebesensis]|uniref:Lysophospholipase n=2 Tax=Ralstonia syzygii subsp. celebesensis TaxID=1310168 RepID=A0A1U9VPP1_9RALS|nr:alpha/beta hydrolase [Ralstonia syzygii]AQW32609.1 lysophospholipase [blood disease bacterium A2-HR MARDI]QQV58120.1 alpha/beta hydrolase [Ralstonia syzygii subsp. celebesensis]CCA83652.1 putative Lysophospholipase [blood disease bacterium R229]